MITLTRAEFLRQPDGVLYSVWSNTGPVVKCDAGSLLGLFQKPENTILPITNTEGDEAELQYVVLEALDLVNLRTALDAAVPASSVPQSA